MGLSSSERMAEGMSSHQESLFNYNGDPLKYYTFLRAFENGIGFKSPGTRLNSLIHYTRGEVADLLQSCLLQDPATGYKEAMDLLEEHYGVEERIARAWQKKIID